MCRESEGQLHLTRGSLGGQESFHEKHDITAESQGQWVLNRQRTGRKFYKLSSTQGGLKLERGLKYFF